jgi:hypothetical protein
MSFWANVLLGKFLLSKCLSGQISFWANVFWSNVVWANVFLGNCLSGQMSSGQTPFWANVVKANVSGQMYLGKCRMGKCHGTKKNIYEIYQSVYGINLIHVCHGISCQFMSFMSFMAFHVNSCQFMPIHANSCQFMSFMSIHLNSCYSCQFMLCIILLFRKFNKMGAGGGVKYVFLGLRRQLCCCQAKGKIPDYLVSRPRRGSACC